MVIAKLAAPTDETRFVATVLNMYGREVGFYRELSPRAPIPHPVCHYAAHDPETQDTVLLLEDVASRGRAIDQIAGCSVTEAIPAIRTLARLHAGFWDDPTLADIDWLLRLCDDPYPSAVAFAYEAAWPVVQGLYAPDLTDRIRDFGDRYAARIPALFAKLSEPPLVLSHADWRLDNLFFTPDGEVVAVDWQLVDRSVGPRDLAYLATQSLNIDTRAGYEQTLSLYLRELARHGVDPRRGVGMGPVWVRDDAGLRVPGDRGRWAHHRGSPPHRARTCPVDSQRACHRAARRVRAPALTRLL